MGDPWYERAADYMLGLVSPKRAALRSALRRHRENMASDVDYARAYDLGARMRGYKSAKSGKNSTPWLEASDRSADGEILPDLRTLRNRSRALNRDDALASGITGTFIRGVVGTGLRPQARTGDDDKDEALEAVWWERADHLSPGDGGLPFGARQALQYGKRVEDGEILSIASAPSPSEPLWIESVEAERLCTPYGVEPVDPAGRIVDGVEKDRWGRPVAYWVLKRHPGDWVVAGVKPGVKAPTTLTTFDRASFDRLEAVRVCHDRSRVTRPGQTRGVPLCHAILQDLRDLDLLMLASLKKAQVAACLAVFLKSDVSTTDLIELTAEDYGYQLDGKIEPGMIFRLWGGEEAQFLEPKAGAPGLEEFAMLLARRIGAAIGLSPQAVLRVWDDVSYSGARTIKIDDRLAFRSERALYAAQTLAWEWRVVLEDELLRGNPTLLAAGVTIDDLSPTKVEWVGDEEPWVDPVADAQAIEIMLRLGLTSPQLECQKLGRDYPTILRQKLQAEALEAEIRDELGLPDMASAAAAASGKPPIQLVPGQDQQDQQQPESGQEAA